MKPSYVIFTLPIGLFKPLKLPNHLCNVVGFVVRIKGKEREYVVLKWGCPGIHPISNEDAIALFELIPMEVKAPFVAVMTKVKIELKKEGQKR